MPVPSRGRESCPWPRKRNSSNAPGPATARPARARGAGRAAGAAAPGLPAASSRGGVVRPDRETARPAGGHDRLDAAPCAGEPAPQPARPRGGRAMSGGRNEAVRERGRLLARAADGELTPAERAEVERLERDDAAFRRALAEEREAAAAVPPGADAARDLPLRAAPRRPATLHLRDVEVPEAATKDLGTVALPRPGRIKSRGASCATLRRGREVASSSGHSTAASASRRSAARTSAGLTTSARGSRRAATPCAAAPPASRRSWR